MEKQNSNDYDSYVARYAKTYGITPDEAKTHEMVKLVEEYYDEEGSH